MKKIVHIKSIVNSIICINGGSTFLNNVDLMCQKDFFVAFFPQCKKNNLPVATSFENITSSSVEKIPYKNNHYDLIFSPGSSPSSHQKIILNKKYKNTIFKLANDQQTYINIDKVNYSHKSFCPLLINVQFETKDDVVIIKGYTQSKEIYLLLFNCKTNTVILENLFNEVETSATKIKAAKKHSQLLEYGEIYSFDLSTKKLENYNVHLTKQNYNITDDNLIVLAFLECLMNNDFNNAKLFLTKKDIKNEFLLSYFGKIDKIYFDGYSPGTNFTIKSDKYRSFSFILENGKIAEIEENNLT